MARQQKVYPITEAGEEYWHESFEKARTDQNWEDLLEIGKKRLIQGDCEFAIQCFIESRHLHPQEPLIHKCLGEAYKIQASNCQQSNEIDKACEYFKKAKNCYQTAIATANDNKDTHFLYEHVPDIEKQCKALDTDLRNLTE